MLARTTSHHLPDDLASLVEDLADARFGLMRMQREATIAKPTAARGRDAQPTRAWHGSAF
jgi:hypothetical protein